MRLLWKKIRHRAEVLGMRLLAAGVPLLSRNALLALAKTAGDLVFALDHRGREVALANLTSAYGDTLLPSEKDEIIRGTFRNLARTFLELFWAENLTLQNFRNIIDLHGWEEFCDTKKTGQGCVYFSAHFGNFELLPITLSLLGENPMAIAQEIKNPEITPFFTQARSRHGGELIPQHRAVLRMVKALRRGRNCGLLVDLTLKLDQPGCLVEVLGLQKWVTSAHAALALLTGARLVPVFVLPLKNGNYQLQFLPEIPLSDKPTPEELTERCWAVLEEQIQQHPEYWLWNYKHWRYLPDGGTGYPFYAQPGKRFQKLQTLSPIAKAG